MEAIALNALIRKETGKGPARRLRMAGDVPVVFYGPSAESMLLSVHAADLLKLLREHQENVFIRLIIDDGGRAIEKLSMIKEIQMEPVSRKFFHADFYEISMDTPRSFEVAVRFKGEPVGVEMGGDLQHGRRELKVSCLPMNLPEFIDVEISGLNIGHHLKVSDIKPIDGLTFLDPGDAVIASISAPRVIAVKAEGEEEEAPAEPEVIGRKAAVKGES